MSVNNENRTENILSNKTVSERRSVKSIENIDFSSIFGIDTNNEDTNNDDINNDDINNEDANNEDANNDDINNEDANNEDINNEDANNEDINNEDTNNEDTNEEDANDIDTTDFDFNNKANFGDDYSLDEDELNDIDKKNQMNIQNEISEINEEDEDDKENEEDKDKEVLKKTKTPVKRKSISKVSKSVVKLTDKTISIRDVPSCFLDKMKESFPLAKNQKEVLMLYVTANSDVDFREQMFSSILDARQIGLVKNYIDDNEDGVLYDVLNELNSLKKTVRNMSKNLTEDISVTEVISMYLLFSNMGYVRNRIPTSSEFEYEDSYDEFNEFGVRLVNLSKSIKKIIDEKNCRY